MYFKQRKTKITKLYINITTLLQANPQTSKNSPVPFILNSFLATSRELKDLSKIS